MSALLVFCKHFASRESHDAASHCCKYSHFEAGESYYWSAQAGGHKQGSGYRNLAVVWLDERESLLLGGLSLRLQLQADVATLIVLLRHGRTTFQEVGRFSRKMFWGKMKLLISIKSLRNQNFIQVYGRTSTSEITVLLTKRSLLLMTEITLESLVLTQPAQ